MRTRSNEIKKPSLGRSASQLACFRVSYGFAQTWTQANTTNNSWGCIASSADGTILIAGTTGGQHALGSIYISTNSGFTWAQTSAPNSKWTSVTSSADGSHLVAVSGGLTTSGGPIYTSTNSGATWISNSAPAYLWSSVASSSDGTKLVAVAPRISPEVSVIYTSTNSGGTWISNSAPATQPYTSVASSADGTTLVVVGIHTYYSTNSGAVWVRTGADINPGFLGTPSQLIALSADGNKWAVGFSGNSGVGSVSPIYTTTNFGASWLVTSAPSNSWTSITASSDGNKLAAVAGGYSIAGPIYTSTNFGINWTSNNVPFSNWSAITSSADGCKLVAAVGGSMYPAGPIYVSSSPVSPSVNVALSDLNLALSWTIPSTNFVLQQSSDLISWIDLTNTPTLNLTNLNNELVLSPTNSSGFFRLSTP